jgi:hypothetical protein
MPLSDNLIGFLQQIIVEDATSPQPIISYFLNNNLYGGWEYWLQVEFARVTIRNASEKMEVYREENFPGTRLRCDLMFEPARGAKMWVELKTQRRENYGETFAEFMNDVLRIYSLNEVFKQNNVVLAMAVLRLKINEFQNDANSLAILESRVRGGTMQYLLFTGNVNHPWENVTKTIGNTTTAPNQLVIAIYKIY